MNERWGFRDVVLADVRSEVPRLPLATPARCSVAYRNDFLTEKFCTRPARVTADGWPMCSQHAASRYTQQVARDR